MNWQWGSKSRKRGAARQALLYAALLAGAAISPNPGIAQDEAATIVAETPDEAAAAGTIDADGMRVLVAPIALYPDDVLAVVLPASTTGLQIVQAQRYLDQHKSDASAQPNADWDPSILALLNYPEVLARMNSDLDWTTRLGDAVINQQSDVMDAIQQVRNEAAASGYLKSNEKQIVTQEKETVIIKSADPEVVYVPTYDPTVVVEQTYVTAAPPVYSDPYPYYYSPAATFFTGAFIGAAFAYGFDWDNDDIDIDIDNNSNFNSNRNFNSEKYNFGNRPTPHGDRTTWQGGNRRPSTKPAGANRAAGVAPVNRAGANTGKRAGAPGAAAKNQAKPAATTNQAKPKAANQMKKQTPSNRPGERAATAKSGSSVGSYAPARQTAKDSNRGQKSLSNQKARNAVPSRPNAPSARPNQGARSGQGAFGGAASGNKAIMQQNRGNRSLGGRGGGGGGSRRR